MDLNEIKALMDRFDTSACTVLELEEGNLRLRLHLGLHRLHLLLFLERLVLTLLHDDLQVLGRHLDVVDRQDVHPIGEGDLAGLNGGEYHLIQLGLFLGVGSHFNDHVKIVLVQGLVVVDNVIFQQVRHHVIGERFLVHGHLLRPVQANLPRPLLYGHQSLEDVLGGGVTHVKGHLLRSN